MNLKFKKNVYHTCITLDRNEPWCSTTDNYDRDLRWKNCKGINLNLKICKILVLFFNFFFESDSRIRTTGGNSNGAKCHFPFNYKGKAYDKCIEKEHTTDDGQISSTKFCSTTSDFDKDQKWVNFY